MDCVFELKKSQIPQHKKIILGYAPHLLDSQSLIFSPIPLQNAQQINYEVGTEEGVMLLLAHQLCTQPSLKLKEIFTHIDLGYLSAESNVGEEELEEVLEFIQDESFSLILTQDFLTHPMSANILALFEEISQQSNIHCLLDNLTSIPCASLPEYNGSVVRITQGEPLLRGSKQFALFAKTQNGAMATINHSSFSLQAPFVLDEEMKGVIAILQMPNPLPSYPYQKVQIK